MRRPRHGSPQGIVLWCRAPLFRAEGAVRRSTVFLSQILNSCYVAERKKMLDGAGVPDYCFMQDGASAPRANAIQAAREERFPPFTPEEG